MQALVFKEGQGFLLEQRPMPEPDLGEVLVRTYYCGICGTDLHAPDLESYVPDIVAGHEFSGEVAATGPDVNGWHVGDRVAVNPNGNNCGRCEECVSGWPNLCRDAEIQRSVGVRRDGGMAPYVSLPAKTLHKLPESVSALDGAWVEPLAVALRAVSRSGFKVGRSAAVVGSGPIGLLVLMVLREAGAGEVTVIEPSPIRRAKARDLGADRTIDPTGEDPAVLFGGEIRRPDYVIECSAAPNGLDTAVEIVRPRGVVTLVGVATGPVGLRSPDVIHKEATIRGSFIYVEEFPLAIEMLARKRLDLSELTSDVVPLEYFEDAFARLRNGTAVKIMLEPSP